MSSKAKWNFEEALKRIEQIVEELESGDLSLDKMLSRYEEGVKALKGCYQILRDAEKRVEILVKGEDGVLRAEPFHPKVADNEAKASPSEPRA